MNKRVLILGCGPAGLMVAHAAERAGWEPVIYSRRRKSPMRGAMMLHSRIPGLPAYSFDIRYRLDGSVDGYRDKVYGPQSHVEVSPEILLGTRKGWDIRAVYDALWDAYGNAVESCDLQPDEILRAVNKVGPRFTISTIPAHVLCWGGHRFDSATVYVSEWAEDIPEEEDNLVICSGRGGHPWYRQSRICGWSNTEYPARVMNSSVVLQDKKPSAAPVVKPLSTDCDCLRDVIRMGRYGRWTKGVLSDSAFKEARQLFEVANGS